MGQEMRNSSANAEKNPWRHRAQTASFLLDFAEEVGMPLPKMSRPYQTMLEEFHARVAEWQNQQDSTCRAVDCQAAAKEGAELQFPVAMPSAMRDGLNALPHFWQRALETAETVATSAAQEVVSVTTAVRETA